VSASFNNVVILSEAKNRVGQPPAASEGEYKRTARLGAILQSQAPSG
jgi:hypothetical protein